MLVKGESPKHSSSWHSIFYPQSTLRIGSESLKYSGETGCLLSHMFPPIFLHEVLPMFFVGHNLVGHNLVGHNLLFLLFY